MPEYGYPVSIPSRTVLWCRNAYSQRVWQERCGPCCSYYPTFIAICLGNVALIRRGRRVMFLKWPRAPHLKNLEPLKRVCISVLHTTMICVPHVGTKKDDRNVCVILTATLSQLVWHWVEFVWMQHRRQAEEEAKECSQASVVWVHVIWSIIGGLSWGIWRYSSWVVWSGKFTGKSAQVRCCQSPLQETWTDVPTNTLQGPVTVREAQVVLVPRRTVVPPITMLTIQLESVPAGTGQVRAKVQIKSDPHVAGLPRTIQLESVPIGTGLLQTNPLDTFPLGTVCLRVVFQLEPVPLGTGLLRTGLQDVELPPPGRKVPLVRSPVEMELAPRAWPCTVINPILLTYLLHEPDYRRQSESRFLWELDVGSQVSDHEFWGQSRGSVSFGSWGHRGHQSSWSQFTTELVCFGSTWRPPCGMDRSGEDHAPCSHADTTTDCVDTTGNGSAILTGRTPWLRPVTVRQAWIKQVWCRLYPWQHTQWYGVMIHSVHWPVSATCTACYPELLHGEDPDWAIKTRPVQPSVSAPEGIWRCLFPYLWW